MSVFMELAEQMCEDPNIYSSGEVNFSQFVKFFSQSSDEQESFAELYNSNNKHADLNHELTRINLVNKCPFNNALQKKFLQLAANFGHLGVARAVLCDYISELKAA